MQFRRRAPTVLILAVVVVVASMTAVAFHLTGRLLQSAHDGDYELMREVLADTLKEASEKALVRAEFAISMPAVQAAFLARDRGKLQQECAGFYAEQVDKYGLDEAQFHTAPGTSFLRLHAPAQFGDDQSARPMLAAVYGKSTEKAGVDITQMGPAFFAVVPIADPGGRIAGSFELGFDLAPELDTIKQAFGIEVVVFIDEKKLRDAAPDLSGDLLSPRNRLGRYIRFHSTNPVLAAQLITDREVEVTEAAQFERTVADTPWGVQLVPLFNHQNGQIGVVALATSFGEDRANVHRARVWQLLAALFAIVLLIGTILIVVRGTLLGPLAELTRWMRALSSGDASHAADPESAYCEELRELAASYELLRKGKQP